MVLVLAPIVRHPKRWLHVLLTYGLIVAAAFVTGLADLVYEEVVRPMAAVGVSFRVELAADGLEAITRHPWLGAGVQNYARELILPIHNAYLQAVFDLGVFGGLALIALMGYLAVYGIAAARAAPRETDRR